MNTVRLRATLTSVTGFVLSVARVSDLLNGNPFIGTINRVKTTAVNLNKYFQLISAWTHEVSLGEVSELTYKKNILMDLI